MRKLSDAQRDQARLLLAAGLTQLKVAAKFGISKLTVARLGSAEALRAGAGAQALALRNSLRAAGVRLRLTHADREEMRSRLAAGMKLREVAAMYGVSFRPLQALGSVLQMRERPSERSKQLRRLWHEDRLQRRRETSGRKEHTLLTTEEFGQMRARLVSGMTVDDVAELFGVSNATVRTLGNVRRMRASVKPRSPLRLSAREREEISICLREGQSARSIAARLGRAPSTVSREVARCGGRAGYRAWQAEGLRAERLLRPKARKLVVHARLRQEVQRRLADFWAPEQIAAHLSAEHPDDSSMRVSHETIYKTLFVQTRGALRKELAKYLRTGRTRRRPRTAPSRNQRIKDMVMISKRPPEVEDRSVPGHWEGDLIIGRRGQSAVGTLVERHSRYVMLLALPNGRTTEDVTAALKSQVRTLPKQLVKSLTWDQGIEMADHAQFTVDTGVQVYFCDPRSPWQRGSNENTNGLLRQYLPRTADLSKYSQADLNNIARSLNRRPRQTLDWMTPSKALERAVASIA